MIASGIGKMASGKKEERGRRAKSAGEGINDVLFYSIRRKKNTRNCCVKIYFYFRVFLLKNCHK